MTSLQLNPATCWCCDVRSVELSPASNCHFGNVQEPAYKMRQKCCFCPLSRKFVQWVLVELYVAYVALSCSLSSAMAVLVPKDFPPGDTVRAEGTAEPPCPCPALLGLLHACHSPRHTFSSPRAVGSMLGCQAQPCPVGPPMGHHPSLLLPAGKCLMPRAGAEMDLDFCLREPLADLHGKPPSHRVS